MNSAVAPSQQHIPAVAYASEAAAQQQQYENMLESNDSGHFVSNLLSSLITSQRQDRQGPVNSQVDTINQQAQQTAMANPPVTKEFLISQTRQLCQQLASQPTTAASLSSIAAALQLLQVVGQLDIPSPTGQQSQQQSDNRFGSSASTGDHQQPLNQFSFQSMSNAHQQVGGSQGISLQLNSNRPSQAVSSTINHNQAHIQPPLQDALNNRRQNGQPPFQRGSSQITQSQEAPQQQENSVMDLVRMLLQQQQEASNNR
jgi:hypothetical protein